MGKFSFFNIFKNSKNNKTINNSKHINNINYVNTNVNDSNNNNNNNNNNNYNYVLKRKNIKTVKDLVLESSNLYRTNVFIRYQTINGNIHNASFDEISLLCKAFSTWLNQLTIDTPRNYHIGILGDNSYKYFIVYLATMFNGDVSIPLDPNQTIETIVYCINHSDVDILFFESKYSNIINHIKSYCPKVKMYIFIDKGENLDSSFYCLDNILGSYNGQDISKQSKPNDNALIIYTSGTTGKKKGVVITNDNLIDKTFSPQIFKKNNTETFLNVLPLHHISANDDFFYALRFGYVVCLNYNHSEIVNNLNLFQPSIIRLVPSITKDLLNYFYKVQYNNPELPLDDLKYKIFGKNLYRIFVGGSYLAPNIAKEYFNLGIYVSQIYALTETSGRGTITNFHPNKLYTIGFSAPNSHIRIVDGEIQIKCKSVFKEYYKDPEKTRDAFTNDGWFQTGDMGFFDNDHYLCFTGRKKNIIVLSNGENISPEYIESVFENDSLIQDIMVYVDNDILCADIYPNLQDTELNDVSKENIKKLIWNQIELGNQNLSLFEKIKKINISNTPLEKTSTNKVIRNNHLIKDLNLRKKHERKKSRLLPNNEIQWKLYKMACRALGNSEFGIDSNLIDYGLNSICYLMILKDIQQEFGISYSLYDLVYNTSIVKLEGLITKHLYENYINYKSSNNSTSASYDNSINISNNNSYKNNMNMNMNMSMNSNNNGSFIGSYSNDSNYNGMINNINNSNSNNTINMNMNMNTSLSPAPPRNINRSYHSNSFSNMSAISTETLNSPTSSQHMVNRKFSCSSSSSSSSSDNLKYNKNSSSLRRYESYPLCNYQMAFIFRFKGNASGNLPRLFKLSKNINLSILKIALIKLFNIHVELKGYIYQDESGCYRSYRHDERNISIPQKKLTDKEWEELRKKFDHSCIYTFTKNEPLFNICIYETESNNYLYLDISELICDGVSYRLLMNELSDIYSGKIVEPKKYTFYEYALTQSSNKLNIEGKNYYDKLLNNISIHSSPFTKKNCYNTDMHLHRSGLIENSFNKIDYYKLIEFCKVNSVTENTLFLTASGYALNIIQNINDSFICSFKSGRTDLNLQRVVGYLSDIYAFRFNENENEKRTVIEVLHQSCKQIMETMCYHSPYFILNSVAIQYLDELNMEYIGNEPIHQENTTTESSFLHIGFFKKQNKFHYTISFWENYFDGQQLETYVHIIEDIIFAIIHGTKLFKHLRNQISKEYITTMRTYPIQEVNTAIGKPFIPYTNESDQINAYILTKDLRKQVLCGWGDLYLEESENFKSKDYIMNPYGKGKLYKTGYTGKFLPDGTLCILENDLRYIMWDFSMLKNINRIEKTLIQYEGIKRVSIDIQFIKGVFKIIAHIYGEKEPDKKQLDAFLNERLEKDLIPYDIVYHYKKF